MDRGDIDFGAEGQGVVKEGKRTYESKCSLFTKCKQENTQWVNNSTHLSRFFR